MHDNGYNRLSGVELAALNGLGASLATKIPKLRKQGLSDPMIAAREEALHLTTTRQGKIDKKNLNRRFKKTRQKAHGYRVQRDEARSAISARATQDLQDEIAAEQEELDAQAAELELTQAELEAAQAQLDQYEQDGEEEYIDDDQLDEEEIQYIEDEEYTDDDGGGVIIEEDGAPVEEEIDAADDDDMHGMGCTREQFISGGDDGLGGFKFGDILKQIAPAAASFIPVVGPVVGGVLGAALAKKDAQRNALPPPNVEQGPPSPAPAATGKPLFNRNTLIVLAALAAVVMIGKQGGRR